MGAATLHGAFDRFCLLHEYSLFSASPQKQQVCSSVDHQAGVPGSQQTLTVMVQGQGQTSGQLQVIPQGVTVIPGPGQQLMQAALPSGQMQRFLFTPMASAATPTPSTGMMRSPQKSCSKEENRPEICWKNNTTMEKHEVTVAKDLFQLTHTDVWIFLRTLGHCYFLKTQI